MNSKCVHEIRNAYCQKKNSYLINIFVLATLLLGFNFMAIAGKGKTPVPIFPNNLVVTGPLTFTAMDGNDIYDEDGAVNGVVKLSSLTINAGGSINNDGDLNAAMVFDISGNVFLQGGSPGGQIISLNTAGGGGLHFGGDITITAGGDIRTDNGSEISTTGKSGGAIVIIANGPNSKIDIDGLVRSVGTITGVPNQPPGGGPITIQATTTVTISDTGVVSSFGFDPGADRIHICGCDVVIYGLVESTGPGHSTPSNPVNHLNSTYRPDKDPNSTAGVEIWAARSLLIDRLNHHGEVKADLCCAGGSGGEAWIDLFSKGTITILGTTDPYNNDLGHNSGPNPGWSNFAVHANGNGGNTDNGGIVTIKSIGGTVTASGLAVQADGSEFGGIIVIEAKNAINLDNASVYARGDEGFNGGNGKGGKINIRSFQSSISWQNGVGDVRPTGDAIPVKGEITFKKCTTLNTTGTSFPNNGLPPSTPTTLADDCVGVPLLPLEIVSGDHLSYVVFCECCTGSIHIVKHVLTDCPDNQDLHQFHFTVTKNGNPYTTFDITASFGNDNFSDLTGLEPGTYVVTEQVDAGWLPSTSCADCSATTFNTMTFVIAGCETKTGTFNNTNTSCLVDDCQWCNKGAVLSQVWQNPGCNNPNNSCVVPHILVDVTLPHTADNNVVVASEIGTGKPATWSIQAAVDFAMANPGLLISPCNEIFIGVVSEQPIPSGTDPNSCGKSCLRPYGGDSPYGVENVVVNNTTTRRLNIFGCSVTMRPLDPTKPVFKVIRNSVPGAGKVTILDLHVYTTTKVAGVAGYLVTGTATNGGRFTLKNARAKGFDIGYDIQVSDVELTGSAEISGNRIGVSITGNSNILRTNNAIQDNSLYGIKIVGNSNELNGNDVGTPGHPNGAGVQVNGNTNNIHDNDIYSNTGDGLNVVGNTNTIKGNDIGEKAKGNGGDGIEVSGTGNTLDGNDVFGNGGNGIYVSGGSNNIVKGNSAGEKDKGNAKNGILISDTGNGTANPIEIEGNTTKANGTVGLATDGVGVKITSTGHQLKNNQSGGSGSDNNVHCEFSVVAGNFNATGNKANGTTIAGNNGTAFATTCQGSARGTQVPDDFRMITGFQVYPNPGKGKMTVEFISATTSDYTISVLDVSGRTVQTQSYLAQQGANTLDVDISKVSRGVYMMSIKNGEEKFLKKIVVQ